MKKIINILIIALLAVNPANAGILPTAGSGVSEKITEDVHETKWYIEGGFGFGYGSASSAFEAHDWCNGAGCVNGYWDTFSYPGSSQTKQIGSSNVITTAFKFGRQYESFSWGAYGNLGNPVNAIGIFVGAGKKWMFDIGLGVANNSIFDKSAFDVQVNIGRAFGITENLLLIPSVFLDFQMSSNGSVKGEGYGCGYSSCWARGTEMLYYYSGGIKTTIRYNF